MSDRAGERVRNLNGGHRHRTEIARALRHDPSVLLLDEPTVGPDTAARKAITDHVHGLAAENSLTVLWATHLPDEILETGQLVILHNGSVLRDGDGTEITGGRPLRDVFLDLTGGRKAG